MLRDSIPWERRLRSILFQNGQENLLRNISLKEAETWVLLNETRKLLYAFDLALSQCVSLRRTSGKLGPKDGLRGFKGLNLRDPIVLPMEVTQACLGLQIFDPTVRNQAMQNKKIRFLALHCSRSYARVPCIRERYSSRVGWHLLQLDYYQREIVIELISSWKKLWISKQILKKISNDLNPRNISDNNTIENDDLLD